MGAQQSVGSYYNIIIIFKKHPEREGGLRTFKSKSPCFDDVS